MAGLVPPEALRIDESLPAATVANLSPPERRRIDEPTTPMDVSTTRANVEAARVRVGALIRERKEARCAYDAAVERVKQAKHDLVMWDNELTRLCRLPPTSDIFASFPGDMTWYIAKFLTPLDRQNLAMTCKTLWRHLGPVPNKVRYERIRRGKAVLELPGRWKTAKRNRFKSYDTNVTRKFRTVVAEADGVMCLARNEGGRWSTRIVEGSNHVIVSGCVKSVARHPVYANLVFLTDRYSLNVWDTTKKKKKKVYTKCIAHHSPIMRRGKSLVLYADKHNKKLMIY